MMKFLRLMTIIGSLFLLPILASLAAVPAWQIIPNESSLTFTATQNGAPVTGEFKDFTGDIQFDHNDLSKSNVKITVNIASVSTSYGEIATTLVTPDWFDAKLFPQAVFTAQQFKKTGDKTYQANGELTLRNKTLPITVTFTEEEYSDTKARMKGSTTLKRTAFGIGQGDWAKTDEVKDDVQINFILSAKKK